MSSGSATNSKSPRCSADTPAQSTPRTGRSITNIESEIDGDTARVRAMFYNPKQIQGIADLCFFGGYYHHELVRTPDGWRSRHLREEAVWSVNSPRGV